jgi:hypothetical protein
MILDTTFSDPRFTSTHWFDVAVVDVVVAKFESIKYGAPNDRGPIVLPCNSDEVFEVMFDVY